MPKKKKRYTDFIDEIIKNEIEQKNKDEVIEVESAPGNDPIKVMIKWSDLKEGKEDSKDEEDDDDQPKSPTGRGLGADSAEERAEKRRQGIKPGEGAPSMELSFDKRRKAIRALKKKNPGITPKEIVKEIARREKEETKQKKKEHEEDKKLGLTNHVTVMNPENDWQHDLLDKSIKEQVEEITQSLHEGVGLNASSTLLQQKLINLSRRISVEDLTPKQRLGLVSKMIAIVGSLVLLNSPDAAKGVSGKVKALQGLRGLL